MWIVVGMANNQTNANRMQSVLEQEGLLVKLRNVSVKTNVNSNTYEIMVLQSESDSAREILLENGF